MQRCRLGSHGLFYSGRVQGTCRGNLGDETTKVGIDFGYLEQCLQYFLWQSSSLGVRA